MAQHFTGTHPPLCNAAWTPPSLSLLSVLSTGVARGNWLNEGTDTEPVAVLGSAAAQRLGIERVYPDQRIWLGDRWFNIAGILSPRRWRPTLTAAP